jgi:hypothetical protein
MSTACVRAVCFKGDLDEIMGFCMLRGLFYSVNQTNVDG